MGSWLGVVVPRSPLKNRSVSVTWRRERPLAFDAGTHQLELGCLGIGRGWGLWAHHWRAPGLLTSLASESLAMVQTRIWVPSVDPQLLVTGSGGWTGSTGPAGLE